MSLWMYASTQSTERKRYQIKNCQGSVSLIGAHNIHWKETGLFTFTLSLVSIYLFTYHHFGVFFAFIPRCDVCTDHLTRVDWVTFVCGLLRLVSQPPIHKCMLCSGAGGKLGVSFFFHCIHVEGRKGLFPKTYKSLWIFDQTIFRRVFLLNVSYSGVIWLSFLTP